MKRWDSRKFIIAILLILSTLILCITAMNIIPVDQLVGAIPAILGFAGVVLGAVAVMYPAANAFQTSKWSREE